MQSPIQILKLPCGLTHFVPCRVAIPQNSSSAITPFQRSRQAVFHDHPSFNRRPFSSTCCPHVPFSCPSTPPNPSNQPSPPNKPPLNHLVTADTYTLIPGRRKANVRVSGDGWMVNRRPSNFSYFARSPTREFPTKLLSWLVHFGLALPHFRMSDVALLGEVSEPYSFLPIVLKLSPKQLQLQF